MDGLTDAAGSALNLAYDPTARTQTTTDPSLPAGFQTQTVTFKLRKDLPVNCGMNWPYQALVRDGRTRFGVIAEGEELVAGAWHSYPMQLGTAVGPAGHHPCARA